MPTPQELRDQLVRAIQGGGAHTEIIPALEGVLPEARGRRPPGFAHTLWQLLEHLRIAQWDILEYGRNPKHASPDYPAGYWPAADAPPDAAAWEKSVAGFKADLQALLDITTDPSVDLVAPIRHLKDVTWLREILLVIDHNAYHVGQFVLLRKALKCWPE
ncbi:MAG: DinB family protein [Planctomycetes bacterium]|nr:DinB family protein [Planctomycetota bacterium]